MTVIVEDNKKDDSHCSPKIYVLADLMSTGQFALCDCSYEVINISIYLSINTSLYCSKYEY